MMIVQPLALFWSTTRGFSLRNWTEIHEANFEMAQISNVSNNASVERYSREQSVNGT